MKKMERNKLFRIKEGCRLENGLKKVETELNPKKISMEEINLNKVIFSICKIKTKEDFGSGFLIKLIGGNNPLNCLMSNEHIIKKDMINSKEKIEIFFDIEQSNKEIELNKEERYIKDFLDIGIDATIIEILEKDKIDERLFLLPNMDMNNGIKNYENKEIYIVQYPRGGDLKSSKGIITKIDEENAYQFYHLADTQHGSSGSPIFIKGTTKVIGIHAGDHKEIKNNYGFFLYKIIESVKEDLEPKYEDDQCEEIEEYEENNEEDEQYENEEE